MKQKLLEMEIWIYVVGYEQKYEVSSLGNVRILERMVKNKNGFRKIKPHVLKQYIGTSGYKIVHLCSKDKTRTRRVHQLVAQAFLGHIPCGYEIVVDHIDNNPFNNHVSNLQLLTNRENSSKKVRGKSKYVGVYFHKGGQKWISRIHINGKRIHLGSFINEFDAHLAYQNKLKTIK